MQKGLPQALSDNTEQDEVRAVLELVEYREEQTQQSRVVPERFEVVVAGGQSEYAAGDSPSGLVVGNFVLLLEELDGILGAFALPAVELREIGDSVLEPLVCGVPNRGFAWLADEKNIDQTTDRPRARCKGVVEFVTVGPQAIDRTDGLVKPGELEISRFDSLFYRRGKTMFALEVHLQDDCCFVCHGDYLLEPEPIALAQEPRASSSITQTCLYYS